MRTRFEFTLYTIKLLLTASDTKKLLHSIISNRMIDRKQEVNRTDRLIKKLTP